MTRFLPDRFIVALLATVGFALKPHQALVPLTLELLLFASRPGLRYFARPAPLCFLAGAGAYLEAIRHLTPAYFTNILPLLRETYWAFGDRTPLQLIGDGVELYVLLAVLFVLLALRRPASVVPYVLAIAAVPAAAAYLLQGTGWYYQQLPALTFASSALVVTLLPDVERVSRSAPRWLPKAAAALALLAVALTTHFMAYPFTRERSFPIDQPDPRFFAELPAGTPVMTLTTTVDDVVMPAAKYHLTIAQSYPHFWMLPAILRNEDETAPARHRLTPAALQQLEAAQRAEMLWDFTHFEPQLVLLNRCYDPATPCQVLEDQHPNLLAWFERDPAFRTLFTQHYVPAGSARAYDAFRRR